MAEASIIRLKKFDAAEYLGNEEDIGAYLSHALETNDPDYIARAKETITRAWRKNGSGPN